MAIVAWRRRGEGKRVVVINPEKKNLAELADWQKYCTIGLGHRCCFGTEVLNL